MHSELSGTQTTEYASSLTNLGIVYLETGKKDLAEALRQAKLDYMNSVENELAAHLAFWGAFVLIGNESAIQLQHKGSFSPVWWAVSGGAGLLIIGLGVGMTR